MDGFRKNYTGLAIYTMGKLSLSILQITAAFSKLEQIPNTAEPEPVICMPTAP
jgi:hypothetical protein